MILTLGLMIALGLSRQAVVRTLGLPVWYESSPGLHITTFANGNLRIMAVRMDPQQWAIHVADKHTGQPPGGATTEQVCPLTGAAINASFFVMKDQTPIGLLIEEGKKRYPLHPREGMYGGWGVLVLRKNAPAILSSLRNIPNDVDDVLQCGPPLIVKGNIPAFKDPGAARRAAVGLDKQGRILFAVSDGYIPFTQWAQVLRDKLGCVDALNLDGGPSAQLTVHGRINAAVPGGWPVPVFLTAEPLPGAPAIRP